MSETIVAAKAGGWSRMAKGLAAFLLPALLLAPSHVFAQAPGTGLATTYSANADKPIDIEADSLEVDDRKKIAIFRGNVSATQGEMNLKSREIQVTYTTNNAKTASASQNPEAAPAAASPLGTGGDITQIDAKGKVFVTTKGNQQATSDWAVFDVKKQQITIGGDVVLSQGQNVIRGNKLVIDLTTGLSKFENTADGGANPGQRMRAIFTPPPKDKDKEKPKEGTN